MNTQMLATGSTVLSSHWGRWAFRWLLMFGSIVALSATTAAAAAESRVRDGGKFFSADAASRVEAQLSDLQRKTGREVFVETFDRPPFAVGSSINLNDEQARETVFGEFAQRRANQLKADVYVMVNRTPSHMRVVERNDLQQSVLPAAERDRVAQAMLADFRTQRFDEGLINGIALVNNALAAAAPVNPRAAVQPSAPSPSRGFEPRGSATPPAAGQERTDGGGGGGWGLGTWLILLAGAFILFRVVRGFFTQKTNYPARKAEGPYTDTRSSPYGHIPAGGPARNTDNPNANPPGNTGGGGNFGRGVAGGLLGGVLGSMIGHRMGHGQDNTNDAAHPDPTPPADSGYSSSGGDFDSGGDSGGSGGDF